MSQVGIGIVGSQFVAEIHAEALREVRGGQLVAVASPTKEHVSRFAQKYDIDWFSDYQELMQIDEIDIISVCLPNHLHCEVTVAAAHAGKHVICEKPLCLNLQEADRMITACRQAGVKLMYAEELCFAPKYVRAKQLVDEGALGDVYLVKQSEKHFGPHTPWFWDAHRSGGGALLDLGCHGVEFARWILDRRGATAVSAHCQTFVHSEKTRCDDHSVMMIEFEGGALALIEDSWAKPGGMDDRAEIYGTRGVTYADLLHGNALETYSEVGYGYAVEKAPTTRGWTFTAFEEIWNYGFPQELQHFVDCVRYDETPLVTGEDGKVVLEIIFAAYASAASGRKVRLPIETNATIPIEPWLQQ